MFGKPDKMDVRCHSDAEAARVSKNAHKESRESKGAEGNLPAAFLKEPQSAFSASGAAEDCNKSKSNSSADPDYCRRILVRGRDGQGCGVRSLGATLMPELSVASDPGSGEAVRAGLRGKLLALRSSGPAGRGGPAPGRALSRDRHSPGPAGPAAGLPGKLGGGMGGPRR